MSSEDIAELSRQSRDLEDQSSSISGRASADGSALSEERDTLLQEGSRIIEALERHSNSSKSSRRSPVGSQEGTEGSSSKSSGSDRSKKGAANLNRAIEVTSSRLNGTMWRWHVGDDADSFQLVFHSDYTIGGDFSRTLKRWQVTGLREVTLDDGMGDNIHALVINKDFTSFSCRQRNIRGYSADHRFMPPPTGGGPCGSNAAEGSTSSLRFGHAASPGENTVFWESFNPLQRRGIEDLISNMASQFDAEATTVTSAVKMCKDTENRENDERAVLTSSMHDLQTKISVSAAASSSVSTLASEIHEYEQEFVDLKRLSETKGDDHEVAISKLYEEATAAATSQQIRTDLDSEDQIKQREHAESVDMLLAHITSYQQKSLDLADELDAMTGRRIIRDSELEVQLAKKESQLEAVKRELARRAKERSTRGKPKTDEDEAVDKAEVQNLEDMLQKSRDAQTSIAADLTRQDEKIQALKKAQEAELKQLKNLLNTAQGVLPVDQGKAIFTRRKRPKVTLGSIDEDDDDQSDEGGSGSESDDSVTVDEDVLEKLRMQLEQVRTKHTELEEEATVHEEDLRSKVTRLTKERDESQEEATMGAAAVEWAKADLEASNALHQARIASLQEALASFKRGKDVEDQRLVQFMLEKSGIHADELEDTTQRLSFAEEQKRLLELRLADTKRELEVQQERHAIKQARLDSCLKETSETGDETDEYNSVLEERNRLANELEYSKVQYEALLDEVHRSLLVELTSLDEVQVGLVETQKRSKELHVTLNEMKKSLVAEEASPNPAGTREMERRLWGRSQSIFGFRFRCPSRAAIPSSSQQQSVIWKTLSIMRGVIALLCRSDRLEVIDYTKEACSLWSVRSLWGFSVPTLLSDKRQTRWFEQKLSSTIQGAVGQVGFIGVVGKDGSQRLCTVLSAKVTWNSTACLAVVFEPEPKEDSDPEKSRTSWRAASSSASDDIQACDSISNALV